MAGPFCNSIYNSLRFILVIVSLCAVFAVNAAQEDSPKDTINNREQFFEGLDLLKDGKPDQALYVIKKAYSSWRSSFNKCPEFVSGGNILFYPHADSKLYFDSAFNNILETSINCSQSLLKNNPGQIAEILFYSGRGLFLLRNFDQAIESFQFGLEVLEGSGEHQSILDTDLYESIADVYEEIREYRTAIAYYNFVLDNHILVSGEENHRVAILYEKLGICYEHMFDEKFVRYYHGESTSTIASRYFKKAFLLNQKLFGKDNIYSAINMFQLGLNKYYQTFYNDKSVAKLYIDSAITILNDAKILIELKDPANVKRGNCYNVLAVCYTSQSKVDSGLYYFNKAYQTHLENRGPHHPMTIHAALNLAGRLSTDEMEGQEIVLNYYQQAIEHSVPGFSPDNIYENPIGLDVIDYNFYMKALIGKAKTKKIQFELFQKEEDLLYVLETSMLAINTAKKLLDDEHLTVEFGNWAKKISDMSKFAFEVYLFADSVFPGQGYRDRAISLIEDSRLYNCMSDMRKDLMESSIGLPDQLISRQNALDVKIASTQNTLLELLEKQDLAQPVEVIALQHEFRDLQKQKQQNLSEMMASCPGNKPIAQNDISVNLIQQSLDSNTTFIEFVQGHSEVFAILISADDFKVVKKQAHYMALNELVNGLYSSVKFEALINHDDSSNYANFINCSFALHELLFGGDIELFIKGREKMIIVPDGIFNFVPFDALITQKPIGNDINYKNLRYLIYDYQIHQLYSASQLLNQPYRMSASNTYAGFAPVYDSVQVAMLDKQEIRPYLRGLGELKANTSEVELVGEMLNGRIYIDKAANEMSFKEHAQNSTVLHMAMHAVVDLKNPMSSMLLFSQDFADEDDNKLKVYEIYSQPINARLAVLSACNTAYGKLILGEGVMSLTRAFYQAGVPSIVSTMWWADDQTSKDIIVDFFEGIKNRQPLDLALRESKLKYLQNADPHFAHPFYWANFILVGDTRPIEFHSGLFSSKIVMWIVGGGLLILLLILGIRKNKSSQK